MKNILTADIGNTNTVLGLFSPDGKLKYSASFPDVTPVPDRDWESLFTSVIMPEDIGDIDGAILSSVVPEQTEGVRSALKALSGGRCLRVSDMKAEFKTKNYNTATLGEDRMADVTAAVRLYGAPTAVFDLGTANVFSAADGSGAFVGGMIAPGTAMSLKALSLGAAQLPDLEPAGTSGFLGKDTAASMINGVLYSAAAFVDGMTKRLEKELERSVTTVVTGGAAPRVLPLCETKAVYDPLLLLRGLYILYSDAKKSTG